MPVEFIKVGAQRINVERIHDISEGSEGRINIELVSGAPVKVGGEEAQAILEWADAHLIGQGERHAERPAPSAMHTVTKGPAGKRPAAEEK